MAIFPVTTGTAPPSKVIYPPLGILGISCGKTSYVLYFIPTKGFHVGSLRLALSVETLWRFHGRISSGATYDYLLRTTDPLPIISE